jgi:heterodisulfide reductase subunit A
MSRSKVKAITPGRDLEPRIGVFVCHCGKNIAGTVNVKDVVAELSVHNGVVYSGDYTYMCSDPGQTLLEEEIKTKKLNGVVVACCSESLHEDTFRKAVSRAGLNFQECEIANIREKCSWVHGKTDSTTEKAKRLVKSSVEKVMQNKELKSLKFPVTNKCLVIGAGIAGIQAALDVAEMGFEVLLVEKEPTIGGHMAQLSETFPTLDCSQCILTPKMVQASKHDNIRLLTYSEVTDIKGYVGNFEVTIREKPKYVDPEKCKLCGDCSDVCPQITLDEFNMGLTERKAIYIPFPQAVPATYTLDEQTCLGISPLRCSKCRDACETDAINFDAQENIIEEKVGAIIVATGYQEYDVTNMKEYRVMNNPDILTGLEFERLLSASGPTMGKIKRPSDGKVPKEVVFIQCSGSRDPENHNSYCSKICCMYTAKHALLYRHSVHDGHATVFYIDIRAGGKDYEEFINRAMEDEKILYLRGKVGRLYKKGDKTVVQGVDTLTAKTVKIEADLVVLAQALTPHDASKQISEIMKLQKGPDQFMKEAHPKLRPLESITSGIFFAGVCQGPKDIPESVGQASGAAAKAGAILSHEFLYHDPATAIVDDQLCTGCQICIELCPYEAIFRNESKKIAEVNRLLCEGCGTCSAGCPSGAMTLINQTESQITKMIEMLVRH